MAFYDQGSFRAGARHGAGTHEHQVSHTGFRLSPSGRSWSFPSSILYLSPATFRRCTGSFGETCSGAARRKQEWLGGITQEAEVPPQGLLRDRGLSAPTGAAGPGHNHPAPWIKDGVQRITRPQCFQGRGVSVWPLDAGRPNFRMAECLGEG